jgi:hypothetical protein
MLLNLRDAVQRVFFYAVKHGHRKHTAYFVIREHEQRRFKPLEAMREIGPTETCMVSEQRIEVRDEHGQARHWRRIRVQLKKPTREGEHTLFIWSNLPASIDARTIADVYRKRWTLETAFQHLEHNLNSEINTLAYPRAALFGFCIALVAYKYACGVAGRPAPGAWRRAGRSRSLRVLPGRGSQCDVSGDDDRLAPARVGGFSASAGGSDGHLVDRAGPTRPLAGVS